MNAQTIRLMVADDHPIVHMGLGDLLRHTDDICVVATPTSFAEVCDRLRETLVDVLVLDLGGMGEPALGMLANLQREHAEVRIIIFSSSIDLAQELLQAGALGYVVKEEPNAYLLRAILSVAAGRPFLSPMVQEYLERASYLCGQSQLSSQELSVLRLLAAGLGTLQIAEELSIDPRSAQNYITLLRRKTGCTERTQLVAWYERWYVGAGRGAQAGQRLTAIAAQGDEHADHDWPGGSRPEARPAG